MWDEIQMQCSDAYEIDDALIYNEVSLVQLKSVPVFAAKVGLVKEAIWELCKSKNDYQRYLAIYPDGKRKPEIEKLMWQAAFPYGVYAEEVI